MVDIYKGDVTNWNQVGGTAGVIKPLIPQAGSGTRSFFVAQLKAANGGVAVVARPRAVQRSRSTTRPRSRATPTRSRRSRPAAPASPAPRCASRPASRPTARSTTSCAAPTSATPTSRRSSARTASSAPTPPATRSRPPASSSSTPPRTAASAARPPRPRRPTSRPTTRSSRSPTTTTWRPAARRAKALRLTAPVSPAAGTPTGTVTFVDDGTDTSLGTVALIGGTATLNLTNQAPGSLRGRRRATRPPRARRSPPRRRAPAASRSRPTSSITESFAASVGKTAKSAKGASPSSSPARRQAHRQGDHQGGLEGRRHRHAQGRQGHHHPERAKLGKGKSTLTITWPGDANGVGSTQELHGHLQEVAPRPLPGAGRPPRGGRPAPRTARSHRTHAPSPIGPAMTAVAPRPTPRRQPRDAARPGRDRGARHHRLVRRPQGARPGLARSCPPAASPP